MGFPDNEQRMLLVRLPAETPSRELYGMRCPSSVR